MSARRLTLGVVRVNYVMVSIIEIAAMKKEVAHMRKMTFFKKSLYPLMVLPTFSFFLFLILFHLEPAHANGGGNAYVEPSVTMIDQNLKISPGTSMKYTLDSLTPGAKVGIKISVTGGMGNDISVYLLDTENYGRFMRKQRFLTYIQNSKVVYQNSFELRLPQSDPYYLVLDNTNSVVSSKNVQVYVMSVLSQPLWRGECVFKPGYNNMH